MSQNFSRVHAFKAENFVVRGNEIVPYVQTPQGEMLYAAMVSRFHEHLYNLLRRSVKEISSKIIFPLPANITAFLEGLDNFDMFSGKVKQRNDTMVLGQCMVSFKVPEHFPNVDVDKLPLLKEVEKLWGSVPRQFSLSQRLDEWMVEHRLRINLHVDQYYYHIKSNLCFRSSIEVALFLLYEVDPKRKAKAKKPSPVKGSASKGKSNKGKRKRDEKKSETKPGNTPSKPRDANEEMVMKFLADAYKNLNEQSVGTGHRSLDSTSKGQNAKKPRASKKRGNELIFSEYNDVTMKAGNNNGGANVKNKKEKLKQKVVESDNNTAKNNEGEGLDMDVFATLMSSDEAVKLYERTIIGVDEEAETAAQMMLLLGNGNDNGKMDSF